MIFWRTLDLPRRVAKRLRNDKRDYRHYLFEDLKAKLGGRRPAKVLEIGPMDGDDTKRLLSLAPDQLIVAEMPQWKEQTDGQLAAKGILDKVTMRIGNVMYDHMFDDVLPFDLIWCTGVLYHNPEQLRMLARLFDWLNPEGILVMETATARRPFMRGQACVEVWHEEPKAVRAKSHLSTNVTHVPSRKAVAAWLTMVGFEDVELSPCHARQSFSLPRNRAAFICRRPSEARPETYYVAAEGGYSIGRAL